MLTDNYDLVDIHDEMIDATGGIRPWYKALAKKLEGMTSEDMRRKQIAVDNFYVSLGITFSMYQDGGGFERTLPFDIIPRIIAAREWAKIEEGLRQRVQALDLFLNDIYTTKHCLKDGVVPKDIIYSSPGYLKQCEGLTPPSFRWSHICGIDIIKHNDGQLYVLEDNARVPSGVSYVLANREIMKSVFPDLFASLPIAPVYDYPLRLLEMLQSLSSSDSPLVVVLTPGIYNAAYFEHSFLAQQMGVELVEGSDLIVQDDYVYMITTKGLKRVDVVYRRIDDVYLDPEVFNPDSMLGIRGIFKAYCKGNVVIANAPGTGLADDKVVYAFMPQIIKYFLEQEQIIPNVPTFLCYREKDRRHVVENIEKMVVKMDNQSGGYGMLIGPQASAAQLEDFRSSIRKNPRHYIAQPTMSLSTVPTFFEDGIASRHVDLRPFVLYGKQMYVMPGGLSRVALKKGSLVVNSSQGGGSKDTWVMQKDIREEPHA